jgi:hypothetical protein
VRRVPEVVLPTVPARQAPAQTLISFLRAPGQCVCVCVRAIIYYTYCTR